MDNILKKKIDDCKSLYIYITKDNSGIVMYVKLLLKFIKFAMTSSLIVNKKNLIRITKDLFIDIFLLTLELGDLINKKFKVVILEHFKNVKPVITLSKKTVYAFTNMNGKILSAQVNTTSGLLSLLLKLKMTVKIPISSTGKKLEMTFTLPDKLKLKYNLYKRSKELKSEIKLQLYHNITLRITNLITQLIFKLALKFDKRIYKIVNNILQKYDNTKGDDTNE